MIPVAAAIAILVFCFLGKIGFGTFIVDPALLFINGYFMTYILYKCVIPRVKISGVRRFCVLLFPITLLSLWLGGVLPYFNLVSSKDVYMGLLPQWFIGSLQGNDFMWNGLGIHLLFGKLVPEALLPTYQYFGFNVLAVVVWILYLPILGWGVLEGQAAALIAKPHLGRLLLEWLRIIVVGISLSILVAALTTLMVAVYL